MQAVRKTVILRYRKQDIDILKMYGSIYLLDSHNNAANVCSVAVIESTNHPDFDKGDEAIVSFRIGYDEDINDRGQKKDNQYFIERTDDGDVIRWCDEYDIFGVIKNGKYVPKQEYIFGEIPPPIDAKFGSIFIPESYQKQKTDNTSYKTKVKAIHPKTSEETGIKVGDEIYCEKNSDIKKTIFKEEFLAIPFVKVLAYT